MSTVLNVKIDPELKKQAQAVAKAVGLPMSTVVAASLREFVLTRKITLSAAPRLKPETEDEVLRRSKDARQGKNVSPAFNAIDDAKKWLGA